MKTPSTEVGIYSSLSPLALSRLGEDFYVTPLWVDPLTGRVLSTETLSGAGYDGLGYHAMDSVQTVYSANMPNAGQVPNLPREAVLESPAVATAAGLRPLTQPPLTAGIAGTLATVRFVGMCVLYRERAGAATI